MSKTTSKRVRYFIDEAALFLGVSRSQMDEMISRGVLVPYVYAGDVEINEGWAPGIWSPVANAASEFAKAIGKGSTTIVAKFRHGETKNPATDFWEEKEVEANKLAIPARVLEQLQKRFLDPKGVARDAGVGVFEHTEDFSAVRCRGENYSFSYPETAFLAKLTDNFHAGNPPMKNDQLAKGIDIRAYPTVRRVFTDRGKENVFDEKTGFIDKSKPGYLRFSLPIGTPVRILK
jgi:hypothetical protein